MGSAADEIDRQIKETRSHMDDNLEVLERRAASNARRYGRIALIAIGALAVAGAGFFVYKKATRPSRVERLHSMLLDALRDLPDSAREIPAQVSSRLKKPLPSIRLTVNEESGSGRRLEGFARRVAPAVVGSATTAILERVSRPSKSRDKADAPAD